MTAALAPAPLMTKNQGFGAFALDGAAKLTGIFVVAC